MSESNGPRRRRRGLSPQAENVLAVVRSCWPRPTGNLHRRRNCAGGVCVTAVEIFHELERRGEPLHRETIRRILQKLVREGKLEYVPRETVQQDQRQLREERLGYTHWEWVLGDPPPRRLVPIRVAEIGVRLPRAEVDTAPKVGPFPQYHLHGKYQGRSL